MVYLQDGPMVTGLAPQEASDRLIMFQVESHDHDYFTFINTFAFVAIATRGRGLRSCRFGTSNKLI